MGLFNTSKEMLDAIKSIVTDGRKQYAEEQQEMDKIVAEKILSPKQKKIAAVAGDKDKIDAADFAALRAGKKVAEEVESLDELSKNTLGSYVKKATDDYSNRETRISRALDASNKNLLDPNVNKAAVKQANRKISMNKAIDKLTKEQVEGLDEMFSDADAQKQRDATKDRAWAAKGAANTKKYEKSQAASKKSEMERKSKSNDMKEAAERDTPGQHSCAVHVKHSTFGEGKALYSQHAEPDEAGLIEWYDIMFEHGIEKQVPTSDLEVLEAMSHGNHKGKK